MLLRLIFLILVVSPSAFAGPESTCSFNQGNCSVQHGFVQDYGYGGFTSTAITAASAASNPAGTVANVVLGRGLANPECVLNPATPITTGAAVLWNGNAEDADLAELRAIQCAGEAGRGYSFTGNFNEFLRTVDNLDPLEEELVFLTATEDIYNFNECQNGLFSSFLNNPSVKNDMLNNAWRQFSDIKSSNQVIPRLREEYARRESIVRADSVTSCIGEHCRIPTADDIHAIRERADNETKVNALRPEINLLISRIPMANRDSMRAVMENLLMSDAPVTEQAFKQAYEQEMSRMNRSLQESRDFIRGITRMAGEKRLFCVDRNLKENLYRSGQLDHTIQRMGLNDALANFRLRSQNRYGLAGTVITEVAMIPTYFVGYGAARLALRAGASTVRAVSMGGRALAATTRLAMLGLEAADYSSAIAGALRDCDSDNFQARVDGQACNPADEVGLAYEESSLAQCLTSTILPFASPLVGSAVRVVSTPRLQRLYNSVPANEVESIVVTGSRRRQPRPEPAQEWEPINSPRPERSHDLSQADRTRFLERYPEISQRMRSIETDPRLTTASKIESLDQMPFWRSNDERRISEEEARALARRLTQEDPQMARATVAAYNALNDRQALGRYYQELYLDASLWMRHRGRPQDLAALNRGEVTEQAIAVVLSRRAKDRGDTNFTTMMPGDDRHGRVISTGRNPASQADIAGDDSAFRFAVRTGPFFDRFFPEGVPRGHGPLSHMIQREIVMEQVSREMNGNPQRFWEYMGSREGNNIWLDVFDSKNATSMTSPETINGFVLRSMTGNPN